MLRDFRISELRALLNSVTPSILRKNLISDTSTNLWSHSFGHFSRFMTIDENGDKNCFENWKLCLFRLFSFHDNQIVLSSHYSTSIANAGIQFFVLPSITRECNPKILELLYLLQCRFIHLQWELIWVFWKMKNLGFLTVLIYIPAVSHAPAKLFYAYWRPDSVKESWTKSSANSRRLILQFPFVAHSSTWLHFLIQFMQTMKRRGGKTLPCRSQTPTSWMALIACHLPEHKPPVGNRMI